MRQISNNLYLLLSEGKYTNKVLCCSTICVAVLCIHFFPSLSFFLFPFIHSLFLSFRTFLCLDYFSSFFLNLISPQKVTLFSYHFTIFPSNLDNSNIYNSRYLTSSPLIVLIMQYVIPIQGCSKRKQIKSRYKISTEMADPFHKCFKPLSTKFLTIITKTTVFIGFQYFVN